MPARHGYVFGGDPDGDRPLHAKAEEMKLIPTPCEPTGESTGIGCGPQGCRLITTPTYASTAEGEELRRIRGDKRLTLGVFRTAFGFSPAETSGLELGRSTLSAEEWGALFAWLARVKACPACDGKGRITGLKCANCHDGAVPHEGSR